MLNRATIDVLWALHRIRALPLAILLAGCASGRKQGADRDGAGVAAVAATGGAGRSAAIAVTARGGSETPIELATPTGVIRGTLLLPPGTAARIPVALIIAGSGPTDRDGNSTMLPGKNNSLKLLAELFADLGVASVRYDKRGIGASGPGGGGAPLNESELRFGTYVDDAARWVARLSGDARFGEVIVAGHSEGALVGTIAAQRAPVARLISLAGAGRTAAALLDEQLGRQLPAPLLAEARRVIAELSAGRSVADTPPALVSLFRPSVQPYLISWIGIDPAEELSRLAIPVLVVQGTTDLQVMVADARRLADGARSARLEIVEGMNHVLKEVTDSTRQVASYSDSTLALHPRLRAVIGGFIR